MLQGSDTRWIHPYVYSWPLPGSADEDAKLPFLNWRAGPASEVSSQILTDWWHIRKQQWIAKRLRVFLNASLKGTEWPLADGQLSAEWLGDLVDESGALKRQADTGRFTCVILAVGFGPERAIPGVAPTSYWDNDALHQVRKYQARQQLAIVGAGDGGLIDAARAALTEFRQYTLISELFREAGLIGDLALVAAERKKSHAVGRAFNLYQHLKNMDDKTMFDVVDERIRRRARQGVQVTVITGNSSIHETINQAGVSFFNATLLFRLWRCNMVRVVTGVHVAESIPREEGTFQLRGASGAAAWELGGFAAVVLRAGTDRVVPLRTVGCPAIEQAQAKIGEQNIASLDWQRLWPAGWWNAQRDRVEEKAEIEYREPVPSPIARLCRMFCALLSDAITRILPKTADLRVVIHGLVQFDEVPYLQQLAQNRSAVPGGGDGRVFSPGKALVGVAVRTGYPIKATRSPRFTRDMEKVGLETSGARPMRDEARSFVAWPVLGKSRGVALVLFCDSSSKKLVSFAALRIAYEGLQSFAKFLESDNTISWSRCSYMGDAPGGSCDIPSIDMIEALDGEAVQPILLGQTDYMMLD